MKNLTFYSKIHNKVLYISFLLLAIFFSLFLSAGSAHAQTIASCAQPNIGNFVPYIYDGELHSFDYTVFDNDRGVVLPLQTLIDNKNIEARYSSEWTSNGDTRVHVDVPGWEGFRGTFPVTVHVKTGPDASCETQATFTVSLPELPPQTSTPVSGTNDYGTGGPVSSEAGDGKSSISNDTVAVTDTTPSIEVSIDDRDTEEGNDTMEEDAITDDSMISPDTENLQDTNEEEKGSFLSLFAPITPQGSICRTLPLLSWVLLAVLHLIIAGAILFFLRSLISESNLWFTIALLVPFIGFLLMWFLLDGCRMHQWFPVVVALISLGTVLGVPASDEEPRKVVASSVGTSGGPVMKMPPVSDGSKESEKKEKVIKC